MFYVVGLSMTHSVLYFVVKLNEQAIIFFTCGQRVNKFTGFFKGKLKENFYEKKN